jgi:hypothetical protein
MSNSEAYKQQPRTPVPNPKGGKPLQNFASKMDIADMEQIEYWIKNKSDVVECINILVKSRGITKPTAYRWYEKVALMVGKSVIDNA